MPASFASMQFESDSRQNGNPLRFIQLEKCSSSSFDKLTTTVSGLGIVAAALRKEFGKDAVEEGCPAFEILEGLASGENTSRAKALYDDLLRDLAECEGDDYRTWLRLTWMFTPQAIEQAMLAAKRSGFA